MCPGELHIADLPSRVCTGEALLKNEKWFHGPAFLKENEENWAKTRCGDIESEIALMETVKHPDKTTTDSLAAVEN